MRMKTSQSLVSEDVKNNTANIKHTVSLDMVPLCRDDLVVVDKHAKGVGRLSGRLCLVLKISSTVHFIDASPSRGLDLSSCVSDLNADNYWRGGEEKSYRLLLSSRRLVRFIVLDVEMCVADERQRYNDSDGSNSNSEKVYHGPSSGLSKYALADVEVARESDFGANDHTFSCVTHLGNLLSVGDVVLGYDLTSSVLSGGDEWSVDNAFVSSFVMPDVVLVRKAKGADLSADNDTKDGSGGKSKAKSSGSKKKDRRLQKEERKERKLEAAAARMGLGTDEDIHLDEEAFDDEEAIAEAMQKEKAKFEHEIEIDEDLAEDLEEVERELRLAEGKEGIETGEQVQG
jgi:hypothetical protein